MINNSSKAYLKFEIVTLKNLVRYDPLTTLLSPSANFFWGGGWQPSRGYDNKHAHCLQSDWMCFTRAGPGCWFAYLRFCSPSDWGCGQACIALGSAGSCGVLVCGENDLTYIWQIEVVNKQRCRTPLRQNPFINGTHREQTQKYRGQLKLMQWIRRKWNQGDRNYEPNVIKIKTTKITAFHSFEIRKK